MKYTTKSSFCLAIIMTFLTNCSEDNHNFRIVKNGGMLDSIIEYEGGMQKGMIICYYPDGKTIKCPHCGHVDHADANAAFNIAARASLKYIECNDQSIIDRDIREGSTETPTKGGQHCESVAV